MDRAVEPYDFGHLDVGDGHSVYWEVIGAPAGLPAVWLHGGPGSGATPGSRRSFDLTRFRAVLFDQRGCGRSRPLASDMDADLTTNTTDHLVADIERLRLHLAIDRWVVVGGSWGVTLGLVYAQRHPERVLGMVLGAVTSGRWRETQWITRDMGRVFPRQWDRFVELVPEGERDGDLAAAYARLLASRDQEVREEAARRWCEWEDTHMSLAPGYKPHLSVRELPWQMVFARLVTHYWGHGCFLADNEVLANMPKIAHIPGILIHGLYDVSGPLDTAWEIHKAWPASQLVVVDDAGHFGGSMGAQFNAAIEAMADGLLPS
jgi:proline iminopeptidase